MQEKLWQKGNLQNSDLAKQVEAFTVGNDRILDMKLAPFDVLGSLAHIQMLSENGLLEKSELPLLRKSLIEIYHDIQNGQFEIGASTEDVHSEVEFRLTKKLSDLGKKIHSGRSRNDQVLVDLKLYTRYEIEEIVQKTDRLFQLLIKLADQHKEALLPGYTHLQVAMISSFGLWFSAYAESLVDDIDQLYAAFKMANKNPLGSGAGYGGSLPLNRIRTTELLGFDNLNYNVVYAQMNRGKLEKTVASAIAALAATMSRMAMDMTLYMNQNFGFVKFPDVLTTGSSIMPHKKNPDVWELIRAKCNKLQNLPNQFSLIMNNLPSGYHRDMQLIKEDFIPAFETIKDCLDIAHTMFEHIEVRKDILEDKKYLYLYSVEVVNQLVQEGVPFRDAYVQVGQDIESGNFTAPETVKHTHEGSLGNLCLEDIVEMKNQTISQFSFDKIHTKLKELISL
ncbi:MAG TPA: argininosuccinate lyase [Chitinophagales bacterium]|nr:argininosuccinate lyase [Chitinophagales bacterium]